MSYLEEYLEKISTLPIGKPWERKCYIAYICRY